jgi:acyl-CoA thioesterase FadM
MGTAAWFAGHQVMTAKMSVNYRRPIPLNTLITVRAYVTAARGRKVFVHGNICTADGTLLVDGEGLFLQIPADLTAAFAEKFKAFGRFTLPDQAEAARLGA